MKVLQGFVFIKFCMYFQLHIIKKKTLMHDSAFLINTKLIRLYWFPCIRTHSAAYSQSQHYYVKYTIYILLFFFTLKWHCCSILIAPLFFAEKHIPY